MQNILSKYAVVTNDNYKNIEKTLVMIDDLVDKIEEMSEKEGLIRKHMLKMIASNLINIEYKLSNKVADIYADS